MMTSRAMNQSQADSPERALRYIPIVHTMADMGTLAPSIQGAKLSTLGRQRLSRTAALVEKVWDQIERVVKTEPAFSGTVRIYQDGLPVCGHEAAIVKELAEAGSRNHRLLMDLQARGAILMGTESPELLIEEYQLTTAAFTSAATARAEIRQKRQLQDILLDRRDRYIAHRINGTLAAGESGILLIGTLHAVAHHLDPDIRVAYPLGPPEVGQRS